MAIEETLERIAAALEKIADQGGLPKQSTPAQKAEKTAVKKAAVAPEPEEEQVEDVDFAEETNSEPELKWEEVNKAFFGLLGDIKKELGMDKAKEVAAALAKKYSKGEPTTKTNVDPAQYANLLKDINSARSKVLGG